MEYKILSERTTSIKEHLNSKRESQIKYFACYSLANPTKEQFEQAKEQYAIALSLEPTMEDINNLPSEVNKGTELETVLMQLKVLTLEYCKKKNLIRKTTLDQLTTSLATAEAI